MISSEKIITKYADIILGGTPSTKNLSYWNGDIPWASVVDFQTDKYIETTEKTITEEGLNNSNTKLLEKEDIIISARGTVGKIVKCKRRIAFNQSCYALRTKNNILLHQDFLFYLLKYKVLELKQVAIGGVFDTITMNTFKKMKFLLYPIKIQKKIAATLSAYDDLIENNNRRISILEKMAKEIYKEWFVRMRFPGHEKTKFVKGIPEDWEIIKLGEILELVYGKSLTENNRIPGNFPVYGSGGQVGTHEKAMVKGPGIIVGRKGNVGSVYWSEIDFYPIDTVYFVESALPKEYLYYLLKSMNFINSDAAVPGLNRKQAYSNVVLMPKIERINVFIKKLKPLFKKREYFNRIVSNLKQTRDRLLTRLISGKLSVEDLDINFPKSMREESDA